MKYTVKIKNYGSPAKTQPYVIEPRLNGKVLTKKIKSFRTLASARKHVNQAFIGADIEEDMFNKKSIDDRVDEVTKWLEAQD